MEPWSPASQKIWELLPESIAGGVTTLESLMKVIPEITLLLKNKEPKKILRRSIKTKHVINNRWSSELPKGICFWNCLPRWAKRQRVCQGDLLSCQRRCRGWAKYSIQQEFGHWIHSFLLSFFSRKRSRNKRTQYLCSQIANFWCHLWIHDWVHAQALLCISNHILEAPCLQKVWKRWWSSDLGDVKCQ